MTLKPIKTEAEYEQVLSEIDRLFDVPPGTPEEDRLDALVTRVEQYESIHYPMDLPESSENPLLRWTNALVFKIIAELVRVLRRNGVSQSEIRSVLNQASRDV